MKLMIIYMHPSWDSFNGAVYQAVREHLPEEEITTYAPGVDRFDPHLSWEEYKQTLNYNYAPELKKPHRDMQEADHILFIFPLWWGTFPAAGKGFVERVFSYGLAYELEGEKPVPLLKGKKASMIFTTGTPPDVFYKEGMYRNVVNSLDNHLLDFCGVELSGVLHFGDVIQASDEKRESMLMDAETFAKNLALELQA